MVVVVFIWFFVLFVSVVFFVKIVYMFLLDFYFECMSVWIGIGFIMMSNL